MAIFRSFLFLFGFDNLLPVRCRHFYLEKYTSKICSHPKITFFLKIRIPGVFDFILSAHQLPYYSHEELTKSKIA